MQKAIPVVILIAALAPLPGRAAAVSETTGLSAPAAPAAPTGLTGLTGLSATAAPTGLTGLTAAKPILARDILPAEGLVPSSVVRLPDQAALDAHYFLAEESLLGLGRTTDAVFARYKTKAGDILVLVTVYPSAEEAERVYGRFGGDFFSKAFEPASPRFVEKIETGDWAGAARKGPALIVILEAPDRTSCDGLLLRAEDRVPAPESH
jgi:hypothetical protein